MLLGHSVRVGASVFLVGSLGTHLRNSKRNEKEGVIQQVHIPPANPKDDVMKKGGQAPLPRLSWFLSFQNVTANHRANDVIAAEDGPQVLVGRFMYGPLDMVALTGEKVCRLGLLGWPLTHQVPQGTTWYVGQGLREGRLGRWEHGAERYSPCRGRSGRASKE